MCGFGKTPKPAVAAPPAPPAPPAPEPPRAPAFTEDRRSREAEVDGARLRQKGRRALRIELQTPSDTGQGLRLPTK